MNRITKLMAKRAARSYPNMARDLDRWDEFAEHIHRFYQNQIMVSFGVHLMVRRAIPLYFAFHPRPDECFDFGGDDEPFLFCHTCEMRLSRIVNRMMWKKVRDNPGLQLTDLYEAELKDYAREEAAFHITKRKVPKQQMRLI